MCNYIAMVITAIGLSACAGAASDKVVPKVAHETPAKADEATVDEEEIQVVEIPGVPTAAPVVDRNERVCTNERRTGTNRVVRVCRTRAEIEQQQTEGKEVFDELRKSQQEY